MTIQTITVDSAGEALLAVLGDRGVDYVFGNAGTDFPPLIEAFAKGPAPGGKLPIPVTVPHENLAVAMAHGYYLATGRPQAVMVHVNVGTANAICGLLNASRENIPMLVAAGRTPIGEGDAFGARSVFIHWGQEMFDQAAMLREIVKWDYELRDPGQVEAVVDRALGIAVSAPAGPVYLTLPREVMAGGKGEFSFASPGQRRAATAAGPDAHALAELAEWIGAAKRPVVVTASFGRRPDDVPALARLAERFALPVVGYRPRYVFLPSDHPMHLGYEPGRFLKGADLIVVLDCDVPWIPKLHQVNPDARVAHVAADPLFSRYPMRGFRCDLALAGDPGATLRALDEALPAPDEARLAARRARLAAEKEEIAGQWAELRASAERNGACTAPWVVACLNEQKGSEDIVLTETSLPMGLFDLNQPGSYFGTSPAGGLGWGLGAAIGVKLGAPERRVIGIAGDGSYMFGNPTPAHYVSAALDAPTLTVILNNRMWGAVRRATLGMYPDGAAAKANRAPLTYLEPAPDYERVVEASGGHGEKVERAADLPDALARALAAVDGGCQAVLNVLTEYADADAAKDAKR